MIKEWWLKFKATSQCRAGKLPDYVCRYLAAVQESKLLYKPLEEIRFVVFDTETTGLDVKKDKIISIGAVAVQNGSICIGDSFETMVYQKHTGSAASVSVHEVLKAELQTGDSEKFALGRFLNFIKGDVLVAHNLWFDQQMVDNTLQQIYPLILFNHKIDTLHLAIRLEQGLIVHTEDIRMEEYSLDALCKRYDIPVSERHSAAGDALITAAILLKLLRMAKRKNIRTLKELLGHYT